jgi:kynurenine formamidase
MIPYSKDLFMIEHQADGTLVSKYYGNSHAGTHMTHPMTVEINGETKNISLIYYDETIANSPTSNFLNQVEQFEFSSSALPDCKSVDAVYYGDFNL